jgi:hypothetical protein
MAAAWRYATCGTLRRCSPSSGGRIHGGQTTGEPCASKSCPHGSVGGGWKRAQPVSCHALAWQAHEPRHKPYLASRLPNEYSDRLMTPPTYRWLHLTVARRSVRLSGLTGLRCQARESLTDLRIFLAGVIRPMNRGPRLRRGVHDSDCALAHRLHPGTGRRLGRVRRRRGPAPVARAAARSRKGAARGRSR